MLQFTTNFVLTYAKGLENETQTVDLDFDGFGRGCLDGLFFCA
ncbi:MAG TPA: hypothetical protein VIU93_05615 [Gallionellaceae bacterium]